MDGRNLKQAPGYSRTAWAQHAGRLLRKLSFIRAVLGRAVAAVVALALAATLGLFVLEWFARLVVSF